MKNSTIEMKYGALGFQIVSSFPRIIGSILTFILIVFFNSDVKSQTCSQYVFTTGTDAALDPMTGSFTLLSAPAEDQPSPIRNIGFTFNFLGVNYTQFSVTPNGIMRLGSTLVTTDYINGARNATFNPKIMPLWDDHHTGSLGGGGKVHSLLTGSSPNRVCVIEWNVTVPKSATGAANARFQCWLYESSNIIEYRYATSGGNMSGATIGISNASSSSGEFNIVNNTVLHTNSITTANDNLTTWPGFGRFYRFTPPSALPVRFLDLRATQRNNSQVLVHWVVSEESGIDNYHIERSADGRRFYKVGEMNTVRNLPHVHTYEFEDNSTLFGSCFYRISAIENGQVKTISQIASVRKQAAGKIFMQTNLGSNNLQVAMHFIGFTPGAYQIRIFSTSGQLLQRKVIKISARQQIEAISLLNKPSPCFIQLYDKHGTQVYSNIFH